MRFVRVALKLFACATVFGVARWWLAQRDRGFHENTDQANDRQIDGEAFLLADFESFRELRNSLNTLVNSEINVYLAMVTATLIGLGFLGDRLSFGSDVRRIGISVLLIVCLLGIVIFGRVVEGRIQVHSYLRSMNRIRRYFWDNDLRVRPYLNQRAIYDDVPRFAVIGQSESKLGSLRGNTGMIAILNSGTVGALAGLITLEILDTAGVNRWQEAVMSLTALITFAAALFLHGRYQVQRFDRMEHQAGQDVRFPSPP
ncbi:MAG: hypothetical protein ACRDJH_19435 [Thermomicrobiales bacterium]